MLRVSLAIVFVLSLALPARADVYAIVPPFFKGSDGLEVSEQIAKLIYEDLKRQNEQVLLPAEVAKLVPPDQRKACGTEQCAERYRAAAKATAAIVIRIYRGKAGEGPATSFQIDIQAEPGIAFTEAGLLGEGGSLEENVLKALREAQRRYRRGPGPWLQISGSPEGATILVDDVEMGTLLVDSPRMLGVSVGNHRLRVEAKGFEGITKLVGLPTVTDTQQVEIRLEPEKMVKAEPAVPPSDLPAPVKRAWGNVGWIVAGAGAGAYGLALLISGAISAERAGDCTEREDGICVQRAVMNAAIRGKIAFGSVLTAAGAFGVGWGGHKLRISPQVSAQHAGIALQGRM